MGLNWTGGNAARAPWIFDEVPALYDDAARSGRDAMHDLYDLVTGPERRPVPHRGGPSGGIACGTIVATGRGWRRIEDLSPGDMVMTFDDGLVPVRAVERRICDTDGVAEAWSMLVPAGVLGNDRPLIALADQLVMLESDLAEARHGDPFVLLPARVLDGWHGVRTVATPALGEAVTLRFAEEQLVYCAGSALLHCPSGAARPWPEFDAAPERFCRLDEAEALSLLTAMRAQEAAAGAV